MIRSAPEFAQFKRETIWLFIRILLYLTWSAAQRKPAYCTVFVSSGATGSLYAKSTALLKRPPRKIFVPGDRSLYGSPTHSHTLPTMSYSCNGLTLKGRSEEHTSELQSRLHL